MVIQIATITGFGYTRIIGELPKMGEDGDQEHQSADGEEHPQGGENPAEPDRSTDTWENFIARHAKALWAVDFRPWSE